MDSTRIKIGQVLYGQKESGNVALVKVESVGIGGINYNDTDNSFQYSFDELFGIPVAANVLLSSGFTLSNGLYVNDNISFIKIKQINGQWFWYADRDKCIMVKYLHELQGLYGDLTGNTLAVDEDALLDALGSKMVLSAPDGFATSAMTPNTVTITWNEVADAVGYSYQIDDGAWVAAEVAEIELTGLTYSTTYTLRVKSIGDDDLFVDSPESEEFKFTTDPLIVLDAPEDLAASEVGENNITITWSAVDNASGYEVQIGETTDTTEELTYEFTTLTVNTEYEISVKAVGDGVTYDDSVVAELTETTLKGKLGTPVVTGDALSPNSVKFSWIAIDNADSYSYSIDAGETWTPTTDLEITLTDLTAGTPYTMSVKAIADAEGDYMDSDAGEDSVSTNPLIVLTAPADLTASVIGENDITITWSEVTNATEYEVQIGETTDTTALLTYQFTMLSVNTEYNISVKAVGDGVTYDDSVVAELTETTLKEKIGTPVVTGEALSTTSVKFSWVAISNADSYSYSTDDGVTWTPTALLEITLTELTPDTSYTMLVKAIAAVESDYRDSDSGSGTVSTNAA